MAASSVVEEVDSAQALKNAEFVEAVALKLLQASKPDDKEGRTVYLRQWQAACEMTDKCQEAFEREQWFARSLDGVPVCDEVTSYEYD